VTVPLALMLALTILNFTFFETSTILQQHKKHSLLC
jgi:hypothetical protein